MTFRRLMRGSKKRYVRPQIRRGKAGTRWICRRLTSSNYRRTKKSPTRHPQLYPSPKFTSLPQYLQITRLTPRKPVLLRPRYLEIPRSQRIGCPRQTSHPQTMRKRSKTQSRIASKKVSDDHNRVLRLVCKLDYWLWRGVLWGKHQ